MEDDPYSYCSVSDKPVNRYKIPESHKVTINVELHKVSSESMRKHAKYVIFGIDHQGEFKIYRRYKEFKKLRELLVSQWLGTIVPALPGKKVMVKV